MANEFIARNGIIAKDNSQISGSLIVTDGITGSLAGTASWAQNVVGGGPSEETFPYTGSAIISGSLEITGSVRSSGGFTGSLFGTASFTTTAATASFVTTAQTASFVTLAQTASYVTLAQTASYVETAQTASYVLNAVSASFATTAATASFVATASWAQNAVTASFVTLAQTASFVTLAQTASFVTGSIFSSTNRALSASHALTASFVTLAQTASFVTGSIFSSTNRALSASHALTASFVTTAQTASFVLNAVSASFATTAATASSADNFFVRNNITASNGLFTETITAQTLVVQTVTSSVAFVTGSTKFGSSSANTHQFTGSVSITGSLNVNGSINATAGLTGSLTASSLQGLITNAQLANSSVTVGSTTIALGTTQTTIAGLASLTSTNITGSNISASGLFQAAGLRVNTSINTFLDFTSLAAFQIDRADNSPANRPLLSLRRFRGTLASPTTVQENDTIGSYAFTAYDGTNVQAGALFEAFVDGATSAGSVPMRLSIVTGTSQSNRFERLSVKSDGVIIFGNGDAAASPISAIIRATNASGTNIGGANFTIRGGRSTGTGEGGYIAFETTPTGSTGSTLNTSAERARITSGGAMGLGVVPTNTPGRFEASNDIVGFSSSDIRFKENVLDISNPIKKLMQIRGVTFDWIEMQEHHGNKGHDVGVIAQEVEKVLPYIVHTRDSGYKAVRYEKIIPLLIEAIKEQQKEIEQLKKSK